MEGLNNFCFQITKFSKGNGAQRYKLLLSSPPAYLPSSCWYLRDASSSSKSTDMICHFPSVPPGASPIVVTASCFSGPNNGVILGYFLSTNSRYEGMNWKIKRFCTSNVSSPSHIWALALLHYYYQSAEKWILSQWCFINCPCRWNKINPTKVSSKWIVNLNGRQEKPEDDMGEYLHDLR